MNRQTSSYPCRRNRYDRRHLPRRQGLSIGPLVRKQAPFFKACKRYSSKRFAGLEPVWDSRDAEDVCHLTAQNNARSYIQLITGKDVNTR